jgi:hypothetical protein
MGMALAVAVALGLLASSLAWLWFRLARERHVDPDITILLKRRRSNFEENVQTAEKLIRKG